MDGAICRFACAAAALVISGCAVPTEHITRVFGDVWDGRLVLLANHVGSQGEQFAIYTSEPNELSRWKCKGIYSGKAECAAVLGNELWVFFRGRYARRYPLKANSNSGTVEELPFTWVPEAACRDMQGSLWVVGQTKDGTIALARLISGDNPSWYTDFPTLPAGANPPRRQDGSRTRLRIAARNKIYVLWSVREFERPPAAVRGVSLYLGPLRQMGCMWEELPTLNVAHSDFCVMAGTDGELLLFAREPHARFTGKPDRKLSRARFDPYAREWSQPEMLKDPEPTFFFDYSAGASCVGWKTGAVLARTDRQRVELLVSDGDGHFRAVTPASWFRLHLAELQIVSLLVGACALVAAGVASLVLASIKMREGETPPHTGRTASVSARVIAAAIDFALIGGAILWAIGMPLPSEDPLLPSADSLAIYAFIVLAVSVYAALFEGYLGATPGKFAMGLRVTREGTSPPGFARAFLRNLFRPLDLFPFCPGAVGLCLMTLTRSHSRLGDLVAGTSVVNVRSALAGDHKL